MTVYFSAQTKADEEDLRSDLDLLKLQNKTLQEALGSQNTKESTLFLYIHLTKIITTPKLLLYNIS